MRGEKIEPFEDWEEDDLIRADMSMEWHKEKRLKKQLYSMVFLGFVVVITVVLVVIF